MSPPGSRGRLFGTLPGDSIAPEAALGFAIWLGLTALVAGSVAFALAGFVGRASAAGIAGAVMLGGYLANGYQASVPAFEPIARLAWFSWLSGHVPLAGLYDWAAVLSVALLATALFAVGVEAFVRRDVGAVSPVRLPGLPAFTLGLGGPLRRSASERLPIGLAWGVGIGVFGLVCAAASRSFADEIVKAPDIIRLFESIFPGMDLRTPGGFLQLVFSEFGYLLIALAAASLVAGWASDETSGRLELLLATPLSRARWAITSALGALVALVLVAVIAAAGIGLGAAMAGGDATTPAIGALSLAFYGVAFAGVGFAVGGVVRGSIAGPVIAVGAIATLLVDVLAPPLKLPDWMHDLALSAHFGQPMVGTGDAWGLAICLGLAIAGTALGGWGMRRRDVGR